MWMKWITWLITPFLSVFLHFSMWITFYGFRKVWSFFFDKFFRLCKMTISIFLSTFVIHIPYVENVDNSG